MTAGSDDALAAEMIGLLREIYKQQEALAQKASANERALLSLNQNFAALDSRRVGALTVAIWGLAAAIVLAGGLIAAAITWGI